MVNAVIFDLDGLLIDNECISYRIYQDMLSVYGYDFPQSLYVQQYSGKTGRANARQILQMYSLPMDLDTFLAQEEAIEQQYIQQGIALKEGAVLLLTYLRQHNFQIALASSSTKERAMTILQQHDLLAYFDVFVFGPEVEKGKPHPDIFQKACEKLGREAEECLVLEDSEAGIEAAYAAQIPVICIPDMKIPSAEHRDKTLSVCKNLEAVIPYL